MGSCRVKVDEPNAAGNTVQKRRKNKGEKKSRVAEDNYLQRASQHYALLAAKRTLTFNWKLMLSEDGGCKVSEDAGNKARRTTTNIVEGRQSDKSRARV